MAGIEAEEAGEPEVNRVRENMVSLRRGELKIKDVKAHEVKEACTRSTRTRWPWRRRRTIERVTNKVDRDKIKVRAQEQREQEVQESRVAEALVHEAAVHECSIGARRRGRWVHARPTGGCENIAAAGGHRDTYSFNIYSLFHSCAVWQGGVVQESTRT